MIHAFINRVRHEFPAGTSMLEALSAAGIRLPALCHDQRLAASGACRSCLVRINGHARPVTACTTRLADGMDVETDTADLEAGRRALLHMLVRHYPASALQRFPDKPFHRAIDQHQLGGEAATQAPAPGAQDRSHPYIAVDMSRCIDCYRCVRICDEVQGQFVWHVRDRGVETRIVPDGPTLRDSSCVSCGACVDTCPTGALEDRRSTRRCVPTQWTRTTCPYCGVGCEMNVGTRDGRIVAVKPVLDAPVNKGHLCVKGRYAFDFVAAADRVTEPMIRERPDWQRVSWDEARALRRRAAAGDRRRSTARTASASSDRRGRRTKTTTSRRSSRARSSAPTTSIAARASATRRAPPALKRMLGAGPGDQLVRRHRGRARDPRLRRQSDREPSDRRRAHQAGRAPRRAAHRHRSAAHRAGGVCRRPPGAPARHERPAAERDGAHDRRRGAVRPRVHGTSGSTALDEFRPVHRRLDARAGRRDLRRRRRRDSPGGADSTRPARRR